MQMKVYAKEIINDTEFNMTDKFKNYLETQHKLNMILKESLELENQNNEDPLQFLINTLGELVATQIFIARVWQLELTDNPLTTGMMADEIMFRFSDVTKTLYEREEESEKPELKVV